MYNVKFTILTILSAQFSGIVYIHMWDHHYIHFQTFPHLKQRLVTIKQ